MKLVEPRRRVSIPSRNSYIHGFELLDRGAATVMIVPGMRLPRSPAPCSRDRGILRGARSDEFLQLLKAIWTSDPVEFDGRFFKVARSIIQPKPVQRPHPPIYLAGYTPAALKRIAQQADGWLPAGLPAELMGQMMADIRSMAAAAGRDPSTLDLVVRANLAISTTPRGEGGSPFSGTLEQIAADVRSVRAVGASELHFDPTFSPDSQTAAGYLKNLERMHELAEESALAA